MTVYNKQKLIEPRNHSDEVVLLNIAVVDKKSSPQFLPNHRSGWCVDVLLVPWVIAGGVLSCQPRGEYFCTNTLRSFRLGYHLKS